MAVLLSFWISVNDPAVPPRAVCRLTLRVRRVVPYRRDWLLLGAAVATGLDPRRALVRGEPWSEAGPGPRRPRVDTIATPPPVHPCLSGTANASLAAGRRLGPAS